MSSESEQERRRVESPCIGVCVIDEATGLCEGCLRTLEEVAIWGSSTAAQRRQVLARIEARRRVDGSRRAG
ncbi:MAG TPA: DUF1289 domain-containing protein [Solirubrobacteraceae bacterium]|nr:DUF1289 domain-containing protein [Solirubrobacteraceae bacterium]